MRPHGGKGRDGILDVDLYRHTETDIPDASFGIYEVKDYRAVAAADVFGVEVAFVA